MKSFCSRRNRSHAANFTSSPQLRTRTSSVNRPTSSPLSTISSTMRTTRQLITTICLWNSLAKTWPRRAKMRLLKNPSRPTGLQTITKGKHQKVRARLRVKRKYQEALLRLFRQSEVFSKEKVQSLPSKDSTTDKPNHQTEIHQAGQARFTTSRKLSRNLLRQSRTKHSLLQQECNCNNRFSNKVSKTMQ